MLALDWISVVPAAALLLLSIAAVLSALAALAHVTNHQALADKLDVAHEALDVAGQVGQKVAAGETLPAALVSVESSDEAKDLIRRFRVLAHLSAVLLVFALVGCASPITLERVQHLQKAIKDERKATLVRPGYELAVSSLRDAEDADLAAIASATK